MKFALRASYLCEGIVVVEASTLAEAIAKTRGAEAKVIPILQKEEYMVDTSFEVYHVEDDQEWIEENPDHGYPEL